MRQSRNGVSMSSVPVERNTEVTPPVIVGRYTDSRVGLPRCSPIFLRIRDAAGALAISERAVWKLVRSGELSVVHLPGMRATRITRESVEELASRWCLDASRDDRAR